ncbi:hypothetical protein N9U55_01920 [Luminiphilus sp.]|nr:hypothetical protein [Luminiphilus sp.]MDA9722021.1 hypothetical protein [Luminiphilus sp.]
MQFAYNLLGFIWIIAVCWGFIRLDGPMQPFAVTVALVTMALPSFLNEPDLYYLWIFGLPIFLWVIGPPISGGVGGSTKRGDSDPFGGDAGE